MTSAGILSNIRILDFTWVLAGPYATRLLADFGAEVIKVQPPLAEEGTAFARGYYNTWNRNKRGITLDLNRPEGLALARRLVIECDAVVENFTPRVMANWGLDYPNLKEIKDDIIMLSMSAMGNTGPRRDYTGFGPTVHALSGMTHLTSYPGGPPLGPGFAYADHAAGLVAALALLGALEYRRRTGRGQFIDISQTEAMASLLGSAFLQHGISGNVPRPEAAPYGVYRCQGGDRWCAIAVKSDEAWGRFCRAIGRPELAEDTRFATEASRLENATELNKLAAEWVVEHSAAKVMALLQREGVAAAVVQDASDLAADPQILSRDFFITLNHPQTGKAVSDATPIRLSSTPAQYRRAAPTAGQDNDHVYQQLLGMSPHELEALKEKGVI